jgi:colanic acid/amylovoran biosynthesis glycosyltransferase
VVKGSIIYVTALLPFDSGETFIVPDVVELNRIGWNVILVPTHLGENLTHKDVEPLLPASQAVPVITLKIVIAAVITALDKPREVGIAFVQLLKGRKLIVLVRNLEVLPKGLWLASYARRKNVKHIHAHWGDTSSTVAMIASTVSGIPWSLTAHRWDIFYDNLLKEKASSAVFLRTISQFGRIEVEKRISPHGKKPWVLHMGVKVPARVKRSEPEGGTLKLLTPARFVEFKGHSYLIQALSLLTRAKIDFKLDLAGKGPKEAEIRSMVKDFGLDRNVSFLGEISHDRLLNRLASRDWHVVVLPSSVASWGDNEGLPVSLIEAMACGIPVISTRSGGIPELIDGDAGIIVPPSDPEALAAAIERLSSDVEFRRELGMRGRRRIVEKFGVEAIAKQLSDRFLQEQ